MVRVVNSENRMAAYYNEIDPYCVEWLGCLMREGLIPEGDVDSRPVQEVRPDDLRGYEHCHFFAGLGGWAYAARLADYPEDRPLWTGSCPCQPFSVAGKRKAAADDRHLWPYWLPLIRECRPPVVFGEQVESKDGYEWLAGVQADLEGAAYAVAAACLPAACVASPQGRHRLWFVARAAPELQHRSGDIRACGRGEPANGGDASEWIKCAFDGKLRRVKPGVRLLADGVPARVAKLRALGNAIVPQVAAEFVAAYLEAINT